MLTENPWTAVKNFPEEVHSALAWHPPHPQVHWVPTLSAGPSDVEGWLKMHDNHPFSLLSTAVWIDNLPGDWRVVARRPAQLAWMGTGSGAQLVVREGTVFELAEAVGPGLGAYLLLTPDGMLLSMQPFVWFPQHQGTEVHMTVNKIVEVRPW